MLINCAKGLLLNCNQDFDFQDLKERRCKLFYSHPG